MPKPSSLRGRWRNVAFFLIALLVLVADQLSKHWIRSYPEGQSVFQVGFFQIVRINANSGAAFGLFQGQRPILTVISLLAVVVILTYVLWLYTRFPLPYGFLSKVALGLILGGTVGNLTDRLNPGLEGVTDFIRIGWWPVFNVADSAVTIGGILLAGCLLFLARAERGASSRNG